MLQLVTPRPYIEVNRTPNSADQLPPKSQEESLQISKWKFQKTVTSLISILQLKLVEEKNKTVNVQPSDGNNSITESKEAHPRKESKLRQGK